MEKKNLLLVMGIIALILGIAMLFALFPDESAQQTNTRHNIGISDQQQVIMAVLAPEEQNWPFDYRDNVLQYLHV